MPVLWQSTPTESVSHIWEDMCRLWQDWTLQECMPQQKRQVVNKIEVETSHEYSKGKIETVSIDFVHLNKSQSLLMVELEIHAGTNKIIILYKIDMGSKGNVMLWHIYKRLFKNLTEAELKKTVKRHIKLRTYNKTVITQLGTCVVTINFKDIKKR